MKNLDNNIIARRDLIKAGTLSIAGMCLGTMVSPGVVLGEEIDSKQILPIPQAVMTLTNVETGEIVSSIDSRLVLPDSSTIDAETEPLSLSNERGQMISSSLEVDRPQLALSETMQSNPNGSIDYTAMIDIVLPGIEEAAISKGQDLTRGVIYGGYKNDSIAYLSVSLNVDIVSNQIRINSASYSAYPVNSMAFVNSRKWGVVQFLARSYTGTATTNTWSKTTGWPYDYYMGDAGFGTRPNNGSVSCTVGISGMTPYYSDFTYYV